MQQVTEWVVTAGAGEGKNTWASSGRSMLWQRGNKGEKATGHSTMEGGREWRQRVSVHVVTELFLLLGMGLHVRLSMFCGL